MEGYVKKTAGGLEESINAVRMANGMDALVFSVESMMEDRSHELTHDRPGISNR
ncbi:hypothetical protein LZ578_07080 [Jeotgalibaca sp. MA1X17-3]|uniref:hypothetical protein n=1 Tax=Jeotgalibaca sp. MA1X17-3 TaxID=2908211 RepID=UPI001F2391B2|nr:hypothetical protein [Jeotgalibaca sp. MA1X17-3]UJF14784.1 hypothetical protein LZ578_07080 [Jeotgalibaca sp. MA1X17-3]